MFYGNLSSKENRQAFKDVITTLRGLFGRVYAQDNLIALKRTAGFCEDTRFRAAFDAYASTEQERSLAWRLHTLTWAAEQALCLEGDFVECGVWKGFSFAVVCAYLDFAAVEKQLYLYDTFQGIPDAYNSENRSNLIYEQQNAEDPEGQAIYKHVCEVFAPYPNVQIVRGIVPDTFQEACPEKISLLHLDMNSSKSEIAALDALYGRVAPGGLIILDDYGWSAYRQQKKAADAFMEAHGQRILELPTGQGLLIRR